MNFIALILRLLLLLYFPFLVLLWLVIAAIEYFLAVKGLFVLLPVLCLMIFLAIPLFHIPWACRCLFWRAPEDEMETRLPRRNMKGLSRFVRNVAREQDLPEPDLIRFHAESVAHVYINRHNEKVLVLGGMALKCLSQDGLAGIVAHELGHFAAGDARLSRRCYGRRLVMGLLESNLTLIIKPKGPDWYVQSTFWMNPTFWIMMNFLNPVPWIIVGYHRLFELFYAARSRRQELAADQLSAEQCGQESAAKTLILIHALHHVPGATLRGIAEASLAAKKPLTRLFSEQAASIGQIDAAVWDKARSKALDGQTRWFDSHPCLTDRLEALDVSWKQAKRIQPNQSGPRASELIDDWPALENRLTGRLIPVLHEEYEAKQDMYIVEKHLRGTGMDE
jgi:Zn-dependent protease with chaperone function